MFLKCQKIKLSSMSNNHVKKIEVITSTSELNLLFLLKGQNNMHNVFLIAFLEKKP